jgi:cell division topological specificity factor
MFQFWYDFIQHLLKKDDSSNVAAGRLKGAVFLDRLSLSPATLEHIRNDVVRSISRYLVIDEGAMTLAVQAQGRTVALAASIPVLHPRDESGDSGASDNDNEMVPVGEAAMSGGSSYDRARARALRRRRSSRMRND